MKKNEKNLLAKVEKYYSAKIKEHGGSHLGVDWNSEFSQKLRFEQLCKLIQVDEFFTINDIGCGYGALYDYLLVHYENFNYFGCDISEDMINAAKKIDNRNNNSQFYVGSSPGSAADYTVASGIFNVSLENSHTEWHDYIENTLDNINNDSLRGFAFNCLSSYSDKEKQRDYLYYADPCEWFDICKRKYSRQVALLHDYGLYEFTIIIRKEL